MLSNWKEYENGRGFLHESGARIELVTSVIVSSIKQVPEYESRITYSDRQSKPTTFLQRLFKKIIPDQQRSLSHEQSNHSCIIRESKEEFNDPEWGGKWILRHNKGYEGPFISAEDAAQAFSRTKR